MSMPMPMISKQQVLAALTTATHTRHDQGREALAGPIVLHLLWRPPASPVDGPPVGGAALEEAVDQLVGIWLRAMATDQPAAPQPAASTPPRPRRKGNDRPDPDQPPRGRP
jgi:hypothetical protein